MSYNKNSQSYTSKLIFVSINNVGTIIDTPVNMDKSYIGKCMIFPAVLKHMVYPFFTSDDYRITVSGNLVLNTG